MSPRTATDLVAAGAEALARGAWEEARARYGEALAAGETPEALEGVGQAAWWLDDPPAMFDARERAYRLYRERGDRAGAARVATALAWDYNAFRGEAAVANGWIQRAHRLLDGLAPSPEHGWLALRDASIVLSTDAVAAQRLCTEAAEPGRSLDLIDLEMNAIALEGLALVGQGQVAEGMRRLDEATAAAIGGEMSDLNAIGNSCCYLIFACERVADYDRAAQWCERLAAFCERWRLRPLFAVCRTHYASVLISRGAWEEAEAELTAATRELEESRQGLVADGVVRLAELRRRQGRLGEATELFVQAEPHPLARLGRAAVALDEGDPQSAADHAERHLRHFDAGRTERAAGLELLVRAYAALRTPRNGEEAMEELRSIADGVGTEPLRGSAAFAEGTIAAASGRFDDARRALEDALELFQRSGSPFEAQRVRLELARTLAELGRRAAAEEEAARARDALAELGAAHEAARAEALIDELRSATTSARTVSALTKRELEVLRLVADGLSNPDIAARLVVSEHTVHRHVANILNKLSVSSRAAAVAQAARLDLI